MVIIPVLDSVRIGCAELDFLDASLIILFISMTHNPRGEVVFMIF
jgi:hypothetical protein